MEIVEENGGIGLMDFNLLKGEVANPNGVATADEISVVCESKSTHNLLLPILASEMVTKYNHAHQVVVSEQHDRTIEWSNIGHPRALLVGYMADNQRRFGVLTSGTRSYFVQISGQREGSTVQISDAWFVGEPNYLRAWAYINSLGCKQNDLWTAPKAWLTTSRKHSTPQKEDDDDHKKGGGEGGKGSGEGGKGGNGSKKRGRDSLESSPRKRHHKGMNTRAATIPTASFDEIHVLGVIGTGRNGASRFVGRGKK